MSEIERDLVVPDQNRPSIAPDELLLLKQERRALSMLNAINAAAKIMRRFEGRINNLQILKSSDGLGDMSVREWRDHPVIQVLLLRRDRYLELHDEARKCREFIESCPEPKDDAQRNQLQRSWQAVAKLSEQEGRELDRIEDQLSRARELHAKHMGTVARMLEGAARVSQNERHHKDKITIARERGGGSELDNLTDAELSP